MKKLIFIALMLCTIVLHAEEGKYVKLDTSLGDIYLELNEEKAPATVKNFLQYVSDGHYNGTIFHRVIGNFMIQGGGFDKDMEQKETRDPIINEADNMLQNNRGTIAMARTNNPNSATSQFFINVVNNNALNHTGKTHSRAWGYAVFGEVAAGMDVVDNIRNEPTGTFGRYQNVPLTPVLINSATVVSELPKAEEADDSTEPEAEEKSEDA